MVRVRVDEPITICPNGEYLQFSAGQIVDGPVAAWLAAGSGCPVTVLTDDTSAAAGGDKSADKTTGKTGK